MTARRAPPPLASGADATVKQESQRGRWHMASSTAGTDGVFH
jgi:hypothetical protein